MFARYASLPVAASAIMLQSRDTQHADVTDLQGVSAVLVTDVVRTGAYVSRAADLLATLGCSTVDVVALARYGDETLL